MRNTILATAITAFVLFSQAAGAMTDMAAHAGVTGSVVLIDGGCGGPEYFRAPNGYCYRKRSEFRERPDPYGRGPGDQGEYYYRREGGCAVGTHPTPNGCRPNY